LLNFDLGYRHPDNATYGTANYTVAGSAGVAWDYREPLRAEQRPSSLAVRADGANALLIEGRNIDASGIPAALRYAVRVRVLGDGGISARGDRIEVRGATAVTLLVAAATSYVRYDDVAVCPVTS
jgi:alpha-L-fucosidase 2